LYVTKQRFYLQEWRDYKVWSQEELANKSGVDASTISAIENEPYGRRQARVIRDLAEALGIEPEDLRVPPYPKETRRVEQPATKRPELEEALRGRITIDVNGVEVELTEEEKAKILAMAKILKGGA
jgi:transcriptional regulator with XRE-family HTH domain